MTKPFPALCRDCIHSKPQENAAWNLYCLNPQVNADDPYALSSTKEFCGSNCLTERNRTGFFAKCGKAGKLWEPKLSIGQS